MVTLVAPCWRAYQIPSIGVHQVDFDLLDRHLIFVNGHRKVALDKVDLIGGVHHYFLIDFVDCLLLGQINPENEDIVVPDFLQHKF